MAGWRASVLAVLAGVLLTLSLAPLSIWPAGLLGLCVLLALLRVDHWKVAFWRGWLFGLGLFGSGASWVYVSISQFGNAPVYLAGFLTVLWCAGLAILPGLSCALLRALSPQASRLDLLFFPMVWVLGEWLRTWLLSGFPWLFAGYAQLEGPLHAWGPVVGVLGIGFILAFSAAWIVQLRHLSTRWLCCSVPVIAACWSIGLYLPASHWTDSSGKELSVGMVQANIDQNEKWQRDKIGSHINLQRQMSEALWGLDLVLWPEAAIPALHHQASSVLDALNAKALASGSTFMTGIPYQDQSNQKVYNTIVGLGEQRQMYFKRKLVPFGEFMPLENVLRGAIDFFDLPMSSFSAGDADQTYMRIGKYSAAALICYEAVYLNSVPASSAEPAPDILLTISNDTWFGSSFGPLQHLQMAQMRALEWGRSMARGTNNGVSALIDPEGRILQRSEQFQREVLIGSIPVNTGLTPFARFGTTPILGLCFLLLAFAVFSRTRGLPQHS